jgi:ppGpp synthetase/RelA/SpoT-type nucleotidyltranferase
MEKQSVITREEFRQQYNQRKPQYERLAANLQQALKAFLEEKDIPYLEVLARVKDGDSAYEKITRKDYNNPFEQIEDWCGLRIICYYPSDIDRICDMLTDEFAIMTQEDTAQRLASNEFGYRSTHLILQVKPTWAVTPNYRGLQNFKAEVQVRTILMHAWAEIEHKLSYKSTEQAPSQFRRKLSRLSAKFEEADEQFEELRKGIYEYRENIRETVTNANEFKDQNLNLDTMIAFLNIAFPGKTYFTKDVSDLVQEMNSFNISLKDIASNWDAYKAALEKLSQSNKDIVAKYSPVGHIRLFMDVCYESYYESRHYETESSNTWHTAVLAIRKALDESV